MGMMQNFRYTLIMTEACNLRCKYCYVEKNNQKMSKEVLDAFVIFLFKELDKNNENVNIDLFGGEPLLAWDEVKYLITKIKNSPEKYSKRIHLTLFSNATLFTREILEFIRDSELSISYNFSLDGNKECNNSSRIYADGSGTWDDILKGIELYKDVYGLNKNYFPSTKFMVAPSNVKYMSDVTKDMVARGVKRIGMSPVRDDVWDEDSLKEYKTKLYDIANFYIENIDKGLWFNTFAIPVLDDTTNKLRYCSAGVKMIGIAPNGDIYPCQRFYNNRSPYKLGNVFDGIEENNKWNILFKNYTSKNILGCSKCTAIGWNKCTGYCVAALYEANKNIFLPIKNVCEVLKIDYEVAKYVYDILKDNPNYQKTLNRDYYGG